MMVSVLFPEKYRILKRLIFFTIFCVTAAALAVNIVVPILVITLVCALMYAAFKHGLIHRMMGSFSGRRFETMALNDNDDDDSPLA